MTLNPRCNLTSLAVALLGTALVSCANGAREDNQAPPAPGPRIVRVGPLHGGPHDGVRVVAPHWRQPTGPQDGPQTFVIQNGPHGGGVFAPGDRLGLDRQGGPVLGVNIDPSKDGLRVAEVVDTSLAQSAGIQVGDVLLRVGDEHIDRVADVRRALHGKRPGDEVKLAVIRAGEGIVELTGTVPEPPADSAAAADGAPAPKGLGGLSGLGSGDGARGGFLGVELKPEDADQPDAQDGAADNAAAAGAAQQAGVVIEAVVPNSAAWFAGLDAQDRLLSIDGQALASRADLVGAVASKEPGSLVELKYVRGTTEHTATVRLGQRGALGLLGNLQGLQGLQDLQGLQGLHGPQGLGGLQRQRIPGMRFAPGQSGAGPAGQMRFQMIDPFDADDLPDLLGDLPLQPGATQTLQVEIDGDQMTIERDGKTEHYQRDADGQWQPADGSSQRTASGSADQSRA